MALEMRETCERCGRGLGLEDEAYVCSFECTFCPPCSATMQQACPNCRGELVRRPRRTIKTTTNRALVRRLHDLWNTGDLEAIGEVYSPDFVAHFPPSSELPERRGLDGIRRGITRIRSAFPDWCEHVHELLAEGAHVASRYTSRGTHRGVFGGIPPTGRTITVPEISIFRISGGKVVEQWCMVDELARLQQLGALPEPLQFRGS
jgi:steroid delta-isomerase-like uncharacterized protein